MWDAINGRKGRLWEAMPTAGPRDNNPSQRERPLSR